MTTFSDIFKSSFLENMTSVSMVDMAIALALAFGIGMFIFFVYKKTYSGVMYSSGFGGTLIALTMITAMTILAVTSNVVLSLGMVGALSIVRFRTAIKEPMDIAFLFWAIAAGIVLAAGMIPLAVFGSVAIGIVMLLFVNRKASCNPYIAVLSVRDHEAEIKAVEFMKQHGEHIENINIQFGDQKEKERMRKELQQIPKITLTSSMTNNLEIGGATTSKASGLAALSELTGVGLGEIMACGDSHNDMAMLAEAGFSVAMGNGAAEVKALADFVAPSNEEEGVAHAVEVFVLDMKRPQWQIQALGAGNRVLSRGRRIARRLLRRGTRR